MRQRRIKHIKLPNGEHVAIIGKSGSTAISRAVLHDLMPEKIPNMAGRELGKGPGWQGMIPRAENPTNPIIPVREPVERFRSAMAQMRLTSPEQVNETLDRLESGDRITENFHLVPTSRYLIGGSNQLYRFPEHVDALAKAIGLQALPKANDGSIANPPKPDLTPEQEARVRAYFAADIALYDSIASPGVVVQHTPPPPPPPAPEPVPGVVNRREFRHALHREFGVTFADILAVIEGIPNVDEREAARIDLEDARTIRRDNDLVKFIAASLNKSDSDVDQVFRLAQDIRL